MNVFEVVVYERKIFKSFCYINLYKNISPWGKKGKQQQMLHHTISSTDLWPD